MPGSRVLLFALVVGAVIVASGGASLGAGDLDASFGSDGIATTTIGNNGSGAYAVAVQPDGKIVAFGQSDYAPGATGFTLVRYLEDGSLDPTFGTGGIVVTAFGAVSDGALAGFVQPDGKIVAAGLTTVGSNTEFAVARYLPDGSLDASFGNGGRTVLPLPQGLSGEAESAVLRPDGRIVIAGLGQDLSGPTRAAVIACLNADGTIDSSFGTDGFTVMVISAFEAVPRVVALPDNKVVAALRFGAKGVSIARFTADGALDSSFGSGGIATALFPSLAQALHTEQVALLPNGDILAGADHGFGAPAPGEFVLAQFTSTGALDTSALSNGTAEVAPAAAADSMAVLTGLQPEPDGTIVLAGIVGPFDAQRFEIVRLLPSGGFDTSFNCSGQATQTAADGQRWRLWGAATDPSGRLVVTGEQVNGLPADQDVIVARYLLAGTPSCSSAGGGNGGTSGTGGTGGTGGSNAGTTTTTTTTKPHAEPHTVHTITGTAAANRLVGTGGADVIHGRAGNDHIDGRGGNDTLWGDAGNDTLIGGRGSDRIFGGAGNDIIYARDGTKDTVDCGTGRDTVYVDRSDLVHRDCERVRRR